MKRKVLTVLAVCLAAQMSVYASDIVINDVTFEGNKVFISGIGTGAGNTLTAKVLPELSDESSVTDAVAVRELKSGTDGAFSFDFVMADKKNEIDTSGTYTVYINSGGDIETKDFNFVSSTMRGTVIDIFQSGDAENIKTLLGDETKKTILDVIGIDLEEYNALGENKGKAIALLLNEYDLSGMGEAEIREAVNKAVDVASLEFFESDAVEGHLSDINSEFKGTKYSEITDAAQKAWINSYMAKTEYTSYKAFEDRYRDANAFYLVNNARYSGIKEVISANDDAFGLLSNDLYKKYLVLNETYQRSVDEKVVLALDSAPVYTAAELTALYEEKIKIVLDSLDSRPSGGGGGGGGSSGGGVSITVPSTVEVKKEEETFSDLDGYDWAKDAIVALKKEGMVSGYPDGSFMPQKSVTREEFVKMLITALGIGEFEENGTFSDVDQSAWYAPYVNTAVSYGIVSGVDENHFGVGCEISRQQMAVMVYRASEKIDLSASREYCEFDDEQMIADYARDAVRTLYCAGKINGVGNNLFAPEKSLTRAEAAKIIYEIFLR